MRDDYRALCRGRRRACRLLLLGRREMGRWDWLESSETGRAGEGRWFLFGSQRGFDRFDEKESAWGGDQRAQPNRIGGG